MAITQICTYNEAATYFAKGRSKDKGRPLASWGRVFQVGDTYEVRIGKDVLGVFTPDNKFEFKLTSAGVRRWSATIVSSLRRALPFDSIRVGTGRYRIPHEKHLSMKSYPWGEYPDWQKVKASAPEYFEGIAFNLTDGSCLNRRADLLDTVNVDARKLWLGALRKFKRGIKVRAKLGAFDKYIAEVTADRNNRQRPDWDSPEWQKSLADAIRDHDFSEQLLRGMVQTAHTKTWRATVTPKSVLEAVDSVCNAYSIPLRRHFGVFEEGEQA